MNSSTTPKTCRQPAGWITAKMAPQNGRAAVVTGTGGLGLETALQMVRAGGAVIVAGRSPQKGADAVARIRHEVPAAMVRFEQVDLACLKSVAKFGARLRDQQGSLDLLVNNAAVMMPPQRQETADGFELQLGTNYLGHYALTAHLLPLLRLGRGARVVSLSSIAARGGVIQFDDLQSLRAYHPMRAYSQSKLACLMFALELQRRSGQEGWGITSIAAHPGISRTDLLHNGPGKMSIHGLARSLLWFLFQPVPQGALPTLFAAASPDARGGGYYGPAGMGELRGLPAAAKLPPQAADVDGAERLWRMSEELAGESFARLAGRGLR